MKLKTFGIISLLVISIIVTSSVAYDMGYNAECTFGECGEMGGLLASIITIIMWIILLGIFILLYKSMFANCEVNDE